MREGKNKGWQVAVTKCLGAIALSNSFGGDTFLTPINSYSPNLLPIATHRDSELAQSLPGTMLQRGWYTYRPSPFSSFGY